MRTYRVIVRGTFRELTDAQREVLLAEADEHDALGAAFDEQGTFVYDRALHAFSFRITVTDEADDPDVAKANADTAAELAATEYLDERGLGFQGLRVSSTNVEDVQASTRRLQK